VEERREGLERIIRSASKKALKDWYDADCGLAMEERRRVRRKFLQHKTEQIKRNNKRSKKLCRGKRKTRTRKEDERN
jgi:hypothetical protein